MKTLRTMLASLVVLLAFQAHGQTPEERGRAIAEEADRQDLGWHDNMANMRMLLRNRHGQTSTRELRRHALEITAVGLGDRSLIIFETPRDIKGTALLSHTKILDADDQWLYLPALKRVKRISSKNKSGPFVGSEFALRTWSRRRWTNTSTSGCGTSPAASSSVSWSSGCHSTRTPATRAR